MRDAAREDDVELGFEVGQEIGRAEGLAELGGQADGVHLGERLRRGQGETPFGGGEAAGELLMVEEAGVAEASNVMGGGGPGVSGCAVSKAGAEGVLLDVAENRAEVAFVEGAGEEAVLPEAALGGLLVAQVLSVLAVDAAEAFGDGAGIFSEGDEVNVVRHQSVAEDLYLTVLGVMRKHFKVGVAVFVEAEDRLSGVAALEDVHPVAGRGEACFARHS